MLFYAEVGVKFTNEYGGINRQFYSNIEKAYYEAVCYIIENNLVSSICENVWKNLNY